MSDFFHLLIDVARVSWPSLLAGGAVAIAASLVGVFVILRREALAALALPQVVAVGAAVALRYQWPSLPPAFAAVLIAVMLLVYAKRHGFATALLPSLYIAGLAFSFLIIAHAGAHVEEMQGLFTGIDVAVTPQQAFIAAPILLIAGLTCALLWRRWLLLAQAAPTAEVAGVQPGRWEIGFLALLATVLLVGTNIVGAVMVIAMLFLPAAAVLPLCRRIPIALVAGALLSLLFLAAGWTISVGWDLQLSQSVAGVGFVILVILHVVARLVR